MVSDAPGADAAAAVSGEPLAIICGGGSFPGAVAEAIKRRGRRPVMFPVRGWADPKVVERYTHHWIAIGQAGRFFQGRIELQESAEYRLQADGEISREVSKQDDPDRAVKSDMKNRQGCRKHQDERYGDDDPR